jgi:subtilisin family serine protease
MKRCVFVVSVILIAQFSWLSLAFGSNTGQRMVALMERQFEKRGWQAAEFLKPENRGKTILEMRTLSGDSQRSLLERLRKLESEGIVANTKSLWIVNAVVFDVPNAEDTERALYVLRGLPGLQEIRPDRHVHIEDVPFKRAWTAAAPNDTTWSVAKIGAPCMWAMGYSGQGTVVAVIDIGIDTTHPDLNNRVWFNTDEIPKNDTDDDHNGYVDDYIGYDFYYVESDPTDDNGHGTMVSGAIAGDGTSGSVTGTAPGTKLMTLKCFSSGGDGWESDCWLAIQYAVGNGADVVNSSFGYKASMDPDKDSWRTVCTNAMLAGVVISAAAGANTPLCQAPDCIDTPGTVPPPWLHPDQKIVGAVSGVITVGTTDASDIMASFSSVGPVDWPDYPYQPADSLGLLKPDVCAPGVLVKTTQIGGGYAVVSGNSFSTAAVSGALALLICSTPGVSPALLDRALELSATDLNGVGKDTLSGSGRINVCDAWPLLGVSEEGVPGVRAGATLRCSPNPFSKSVTFAIAGRAGARGLCIYDVAGRKIRAFDPSGTAVEEAFVWDGRTSSGELASSGLYFVRLDTKVASFTTKLVLVR